MKKVRMLALLATLGLAACATSQTNPGTDVAAARQAAEVNTSLGREYMNRGQYEVALEKLKKAVNADPAYAPGHTMLAVLYEQINENGLAEIHYRKAVDANPSNGDVNNNFGVFLCQSGKIAQAQTHFLRAVEDPFYRTPAVAYANAGSCELQGGNLDKATRFLRQSLEYDADFPDALLPMASISFQKREFLRARAFLQRYEAAGPASAESLFLGFRIENRLNDQKAAQEYAGRLQERFPDSEQAREALGNRE